MNNEASILRGQIYWTALLLLMALVSISINGYMPILGIFLLYFVFRFIHSLAKYYTYNRDKATTDENNLIQTWSLEADTIEVPATIELPYTADRYYDSLQSITVKPKGHKNEIQ